MCALFAIQLGLINSPNTDITFSLEGLINI